MFTDFGFKTVEAAKKHNLVKHVFANVSSKYDVMNDLMSGSLHRLWKDKLVEKLPLKQNDHILDLAGGTGDITFRLLKKFHHYDLNLMVFDLTLEMMCEGQKRAVNKGILDSVQWVCGQGESMPYDNDSFHGVVTSFGFRNMANKDDVLQEVYRVLKPGGWFYCLEFSKPMCALFEKIYKFYSFQIIPKIGQYVANDAASYQYLVESIQKFPDQETLKQMVMAKGFKHVSFDNLMNGLVAIHWGYKE
jgi:demethylmenaquinone methyltransferase/2-methoxy-6-polyprenyl-1,4-benzoquinol methylase